MTDDFLLPSNHASAFLPESAPLRRLPRAPGRSRPEGFVRDKFEGRALVYDAFWHDDRKRILVVGPPPMTLGPLYKEARYFALPSRTALKASCFKSLSVMVTALAGAPEGTEQLKMHLGGATYELVVQPNGSRALAGRRVLFTMSRDNELAWIREWAHYHAAVQGTDAIVFFDNGSTRYGVAEIAATLKSVAGIAHAAVLSWPYRYGATDPAVRTNPYYGLFLQIASMSVALRRYGARAFGLLNCDIDELVATPEGTTIYELAHAARQGLVAMPGQFIEALPSGDGTGGVYTHRDFGSRRRDAAARLSSPRKWALDPSRAWVGGLGVHPYMHWIEGRPPFGKTVLPEVFYWHFRGINTNWKEARTDASGLRPEDVEVDARFAGVVESEAFRGE